MQAILTWFTLVIEYLRTLPLKINTYIRTLIEAVIQWLTELVTTTLPHWLADILPQSWVDFLNQPLITDIISLVDAVIWFYPLWQVLILYQTAYGIVAVIRIIRWIIGIIPTVEG